jgi:hypothetical protein
MTWWLWCIISLSWDTSAVIDFCHAESTGLFPDNAASYPDWDRGVLIDLAVGGGASDRMPAVWPLDVSSSVVRICTTVVGTQISQKPDPGWQGSTEDAWTLRMLWRERMGAV